MPREAPIPIPADPARAIWRRDHPLWQAAHRPLFLCAGLCALLTPAVWLWPGLPVADPRRWHLYELVFGMGGAAMGGYLLTALPAWTGEAGRIAAPAVRTLTLLWVLARLALPLGESLPAGLAPLMALGYFAALAVLLARPVIAARFWRRLWAAVAAFGMGLGNAVFLADPPGLPDPAALPLAMVLLLACLIGHIGGRAVPAFTRSRLRGRAEPAPMRGEALLAASALVATALAAGLVLAGQARAAGACLLIAGVSQGIRLAGWQRLRGCRDPALMMLHLAWAWLPVGLILLGSALLHPGAMAQVAALHALTMGAMGTMMIAIAGRAAMARRDGRLIAGRGLILAFALVWLAALLRVLAPLAPAAWPDPITASAGIWMLGWAVYLGASYPALRGPVPFPVLSARQSPKAPVQTRPEAAPARLF